MPIELPIELPIEGPRVPGWTGLGSARFARAWGVGKGVGEGGARGPGPGQLRFFNTLKTHDSDGDVNIILLRNMTVIRMLI